MGVIPNWESQIGSINQKTNLSRRIITALSSETAATARLAVRVAPFPILIRTANGTVPAQTAVVPTVRVGNVVTHDLPVVVSPAFGDMNVVGMNFLSRLKGWRVEDGALIPTPHRSQRASQTGVTR
ncbi:retropepsin-like aspartic protease [Sphingomonas oligophenolica]|uniref:retropepsin-like aspartic protease n=1 Tax=Sphingomonas oligophenolica TaxID=301154 RepID=UPI001F4F2FD8|nr:retropepsin-like aspartic protease [Sphingomonas oligophenolica]